MRRMISIVAFCLSAKLCALAAPGFRSQQYQLCPLVRKKVDAKDQFKHDINFTAENKWLKQKKAQAA